MITLLLSLQSMAHAVPMQMTHQGRLLDSNGAAITGVQALTFTIFDDPNNGTDLWAETLSVQFNNGYYAAVLGSDEQNNPLDSLILSQYPLFLELQVAQGTPLVPRTPLQSVPYAQVSGTAESVDGGVVTASEVNIGSQPVINAQGEWVGSPLSIGWSDIDPSTIPGDLADGDNDTQLSEGQIEGYITNGAIGLAPSSTIQTQGLILTESSSIPWSQINPATLPSGLQDGDDVLSESDVETMVTNGALDLATNTTVNGEIIVTTPPNCLNGQTLSYDAASGLWNCIDFSNIIDQDGDGILAWNDCDDNDGSLLAQVNDADCDGIESSDDCDDTNSNIGDSGTGSSQDCAAMSCSEILANGYSVGDASYWIDPESTGTPFQVDCIMNSNGGGWIALSMNNSNNILMAQESSSNPWRKCGDDSAKHYNWISEGSVSADYSPSSNTYTATLSYIQPSTGATYSAAQISALRTIVTELSSSTRLVAVTADDDNYSYQDGDVSGHEVYAKGETGGWVLLTPGTNGECGGSSGWGQSQAGHYLWSTSAADSVVDGVTNYSNSSMGALPTGLLIPYQVQLAIYSGGGASMGWEQSSFWVK